MCHMATWSSLNIRVLEGEAEVGGLRPESDKDLFNFLFLLFFLALCPFYEPLKGRWQCLEEGIHFFRFFAHNTIQKPRTFIPPLSLTAGLRGQYRSYCPSILQTYIFDSLLYMPI